jgi:glucokinase
LYLTVGSGIGGGLVCGGKIYRGNGQGALEIGHLRPGNPPRHVSCRATTVESVASGFGIKERARRVIADWESTSLFVESRFEASTLPPDRGDQIERGEFHHPHERFATLLKLADHQPAKITARLVAQAAAQGDRLCRELLSDATEALGWAVAQAVTLLNPARVVIGGGVSLIGQELFFEPVRRACRAEAFKPFAGVADIVPAALGEEVVVHGALALARAAFSQEPNLRPFAPP